MTKREELEKEIQALMFALDLMNENRSHYEKLHGGQEGLDRWIDEQLDILKKKLDELNQTSNKNY